jgi:hypothetical protein
MAKSILIIEDKFNIALNLLYEQFLDLRKYGIHHPVMTNVSIVYDNTSEFIEYEIVEEIKLFGLIKLRPNYKAKVFEIEKYKHLQYTSQVKNNIYLKIDLVFSEFNGIVNFKETIEITGNPIIVSVFMSILKKAHLQLNKNIKVNFKS